jgi:PKD repeat protein
MKTKQVLLTIALIAVIIGVLICTGVLPLLQLVTSGAIKVVDDYGVNVPGANVVGVATIDTFHWLGDIWNEKTSTASPDGVIDSYDCDYIKSQYGTTSDYLDMNGDGKVGIEDQTWVNSHVGLTIEGTKSSNVTQTDGTCSLQYYSLLRNDKFPYYSVTVSKTGYHSSTMSINMKGGGQIVLPKNKPPVAVINYSPTIPMVGKTVTFDGSSSYDLDGHITSYSWTLTDGGATKSFSGANFTYAYTNYGDSVVTLTVTDDLGATGSTSKTIHVNAINVIASISANPTSGYVPLTVSFDGSGSYDPDSPNAPNKGIVSYVWDFGDGSGGTGVKVSHTYSKAGTFTVKLTVTDDEGTTGSTTTQINVYSQPGYADFKFSPSKPYAGESVTFDGSASTPSSGATITAYHWLVNSVKQATTSTAIWTYTFSSTGSYNVGLYIVDSSGYTSLTATKSVTVIDRPLADFTYSGMLGVGETISFSFTGKGEITSYSWDFGDSSTSNAGPTTTHTYSNTGTFTVKLTVSDGKTSDTTSKAITISPQKFPVDCLTLLQFPPNTAVSIKLLAKTSGGNPLSGVSFTVTILPKGDYAGTSVTTQPTSSDGTVVFTITSPPYSKLSPYNMTVNYQEQTVAWFDFYVLPKIAIKQVSFNYEQVYTPGSYDFSYSGSLVDAEDMSTPLIDVSAYSKTLVDEKGTAIPVEYTNWNQQGNSFTFQAKTYDYYKSYDTHTLTLTIVFRKSGYIDGVLNATAKMVAPTIMAVVESSSVPVGKDTFTIAFKDKYGQPYAGLTEQNIEVTITDPDGVSMSTATQLQYTFSGATKSITVAYTFSKIGTYKVVVKYSGLAFYQEPSVFTVTTSEAPSIPPILTNPYVLVFIGLIILIVLLRRRKK